MTPAAVLNQKLERTFLDLATIDEVYPHEDVVLAYIKQRLESAKVPYRQDKVGNIVARIPGTDASAVALVAHVDIAAPLGGRSVVVTEAAIQTDGTGLLGADDKAAVAALLELADHAASHRPGRTVELIFTVGEEAGCIGAVALDLSLVASKQVLVFDWMGGVNHIVTKSPAYVKVDVEYTGRTAHPAEWQQGRNAGAALIDAAARLKVGEYAPGVTCNVGLFAFGQARNQVPGRATLQAELRSYDTAQIETAAAEVEQLFRQVAARHKVEAKLVVVKDSPAYSLNKSGTLLAGVSEALAELDLAPVFEPTYGCFDANILAGRGLETVILGAGYYRPHSPGEYLDRREFSELFEFVKKFVS